MSVHLYKIQQRIKYRIFLKFLIYTLVLNFFCGPLLAQEARRGMFLQDQISGQENPENFRQDGESDSTGYDQDEMTGYGRSSRGRIGMESSGLSDRSLIYQVHVLGEVRRPGTFRVSPSMRVTDALLQAGGLKPMGSERFIQLRKLGQKNGQTLDLFAYKTFGELSQNPYLQDNDTLLIPLKKRAIEIEGPIRRPGVFELRNENSLQDIVDLGGGFTVGVDPKETIKVVRYGGNEDKEVIPVSMGISDLRSFQVQDGDVIIVPHKFLAKHEFDYNVKKLPNDNIFYPSYDNRVFVIGAVRVPGAFDFNQYYSVRNYLTLAGGTTTMAKNGQIKVVTVDGKTVKAKDGKYDGVINPGDTIVVPEKSIPTAFYIGLLPTIASLGLSATALFK